jgi:two-component system NarL family response regulator
MSTRVVLIYGHQLLSDGLAILLKMHKEIDLVGISDSLAQAKELRDALEPDVMVIGVDLHRMDADFEALHCLSGDKTQIVVLADNFSAWRAAQPQVSLNYSWVSSRSSLDELLLAIRTAATGRCYRCERTRQVLNRDVQRVAPSGTDALPRLAVREHQVLRLIAQGFSSKEIARDLHIAPSTVEVHRRNIMRKVNLHKVADLTRYAIRHHLISHETGKCASADKGLAW